MVEAEVAAAMFARSLSLSSPAHQKLPEKLPQANRDQEEAPRLSAEAGSIELRRRLI